MSTLYGNLQKMMVMFFPIDQILFAKTMDSVNLSFNSDDAFLKTGTKSAKLYLVGNKRVLQNSSDYCQIKSLTPPRLHA